jgi:flagellar biosynthesis protein FliP
MKHQIVIQDRASKWLLFSFRGLGCLVPTGEMLMSMGCGVLAILLMLWPETSEAATRIRLDLGDSSEAQVDGALKMAALLTFLTVAPAILMTTTCFVRITVVFAFLRMALGTQNAPPQQVLIGLSLFLTIAVMAPVGTKVYEQGLQPYLDGQMDAREAFNAGSPPLRNFMLRQTRQEDLGLFYEISREPRPQDAEAVKLHLLIPAFIISELRTAFEMGFLLFVPFLLLDIVVASVTMALGLVMLPPAMLSLPLKIMIFVLADGWNLIVSSLVRSFG